MIHLCVSLLVPVCAEYVFVCECDIKSECWQQPFHLCETYCKLDVLLHKMHNKVLLVLRYQFSTSEGKIVGGIFVKLGLGGGGWGDQEPSANYELVFPLDTGGELNVHKMIRSHPGPLLNVLCTFNSRLLSMELVIRRFEIFVATRVSWSNVFGGVFTQSVLSCFCTRSLFLAVLNRKIGSNS